MSTAHSQQSAAPRRTPLAARIAGLVAAIALASVALLALPPAAPAAAAVDAAVGVVAVASQCNNAGNAGGQGIRCDITVRNFLNIATGAERSRVTTVDCRGAANAVICDGAVVVEKFTELTRSANQCNGDTNGGGGTLRCTMKVINTITGAATTSIAPINQCVGSLDTGSFRACNPSPATADASVDGVTQCNGSVNGGGGSMTCTVSASTTSNSGFNFLANQCNGSSNGGGGLIVCTVDIKTVVLAAETTDGETGDEASDGEAEGRTFDGVTGDEIPGGETGGETEGETGGETTDSETVGRTLANTGADTGVALGIAALLLMSGVAALALSRQRSVRAAR
jgi:hypothetical protein